MAVGFVCRDHHGRHLDYLNSNIVENLRPYALTCLTSQSDIIQNTMQWSENGNNRMLTASKEIRYVGRSQLGSM